MQHADEDIANLVVESFAQDRYIMSTNITVQISNGKVTFKGTTPIWIAKRNAEEIANNTSGVTDVDNQITVHLQKQE